VPNTHKPTLTNCHTHRFSPNKKSYTPESYTQDGCTQESCTKECGCGKENNQNGTTTETKTAVLKKREQEVVCDCHKGSSVIGEVLCRYTYKYSRYTYNYMKNVQSV